MRRLLANRLVFATGVTVTLISALFALLRVDPAVARGFSVELRGVMSAYTIELLGILIALGLLIFLAYRGVTLLLAAPAAAIVAAAFSGEPLLGR